MYTALKATSLTIAHIVRQHLIADINLRVLFDPGLGGTMVISLNSPQEMTTNNQQGVSFWLYRIEKDGERFNEPAERISSTQVRRRPLPLLLHYLVTPIVNAAINTSPETEQIILGKVLQVLHDHPILRGTDLQDDFSGTEVELRIRLEAMTVDEASRVFDALERSYQLSAAYQVGAVMIESGHEPYSARPVQVAMPDYGVITGE
jgi:hypothetical protein